MNRSKQIRLLESLPVFRKKSYAQLETFSAYMDFLRYEQGEYIYQEGDDSSFIGFILSGEVEIIKKQGPINKVIYYLKSRRAIGFSMLAGRPRPVSSRALKETLIAQITDKMLERLTVENVALAAQLYADLLYFMIHVLRQLTSTIVDNLKLVEYKTGKSLPDLILGTFQAACGSQSFRRLNDRRLEQLSRYTMISTYEKGEVLFREHEASDFLAYIVEGEVEVDKERSDGSSNTLGVLRSGMMTGVSVFDDYLRPTTVTARSRTTLLQMDRKSLNHIKLKEPALAVEIFADAACFMMQVLDEFANLTAEYLDLPIE